MSNKSDIQKTDDTVSTKVAHLAQEFQKNEFGFMHLEGVENARDLGGMPTHDSKVIAPTRLIRSARLERMSQSDSELLKDIGLNTIIDFRVEQEREKAPDPLELLPEASALYVPVINPLGPGTAGVPGASLREVIGFTKGSNDEAIAFIHKLYQELFLGDMAHKGFRTFFEVLLEVGANKDGAVLWHCTSGKDRTGVAAVLLEHALGVPDTLIRADYMASNLFFTTRIERALEDLSDHIDENIEALVRDFFGVNEANLVGALNVVRKEYGSLDAYMKQELGVDEDVKRELRSYYLKDV